MEEQTSAGGVVIKDNEKSLEILLIKDRFGHWTWPKGHIEDGETPQEAALREISEETGLSDLEIVEQIGEQRYSFIKDDKEISKKVTIFLVKYQGEGSFKVQTSEIDSAVWYSPEEAVEMIEYNGSKDILNNGIDAFRRKYR